MEIQSTRPVSGAVMAPVQKNGGAPARPTLPASMDLRSAMFALHSAGRDMQTKASVADASSAQSACDRAVDAAREALAKAEEEQRAADEKGAILGTLKTVATVAAAVAAVASVVCTAGASAPAIIALVGVAMSASSPLVEDATGSKAAGTSAAIAGSVLSLGAGVFSAASTAAQAAGAASTAAQVAKGVSTGARLVEGTARMGEGVVTIKRGNDLEAAENSRADAKEHNVAGKRADFMADEAIEMLQSLEKASRRAVGIITSVGKQIDSTKLTVAHSVGGRV